MSLKINFARLPSVSVIPAGRPPTTSSFDSFESYAIGAIVTFDGGTGWNTSGVVNSYRYESLYDSFESYATGSITTLTDGTNWAANGTIVS